MSQHVKGGKCKLQRWKYVLLRGITRVPKYEHTGDNLPCLTVLNTITIFREQPDRPAGSCDSCERPGKLLVVIHLKKYKPLKLAAQPSFSTFSVKFECQRSYN